MSRRCLVDASSTLIWLFEEEPNAVGVLELLRSIDVVVPALWRLEVLHVVLKRQRAHLDSPAESRAYLRSLEAFAMEVLPDPGSRGMESLFDVAKPHQLSSYDAVYLDAALRFRLPLLTHDRNLRLAAEREGVELL